VILGFSVTKGRLSGGKMMGRIFVPEKNIATRVETDYIIYHLPQREKQMHRNFVRRTQRMRFLKGLIVDNIKMYLRETRRGEIKWIERVHNMAQFFFII
jgi:hypothetical protein